MKGLKFENNSSSKFILKQTKCIVRLKTKKKISSKKKLEIRFLHLSHKQTCPKSNSKYTQDIIKKRFEHIA